MDNKEKKIYHLQQHIDLYTKILKESQNEDPEFIQSIINHLIHMNQLIYTIKQS